MALADHYVSGAQVTFCDLNDYERMLVRDIEHDVVRKPLLSILHRRGTHTFIVTERSVEGVMLSMAAANQGLHHSRVRLEPRGSQCTLEALRRAAEVVCNEHGITLVNVRERPIPARKIPDLHYAYTVSY